MGKHGRPPDDLSLLFRRSAPRVPGKRLGTLYFIIEGFSCQVRVLQPVKLFKQPILEGFEEQDLKHVVSGPGFGGCHLVNLFKDFRGKPDADLFFTHMAIIGSLKKKINCS
jgi:hypothetical protein